MPEYERHNFEPFEPHLSSPESIELAETHAKICEHLATHPDISFKDIPAPLHELVQVHVITCQDNVHRIEGAPTDSD